jgi:hypothetical protein
MLLSSDLVAPERSNNMQNRYTSCSWLFRFAVRFPLLSVYLFIGFRIVLHDTHFKTLFSCIYCFSRPRFRDIFSPQGGILVFVTPNTRNHYRPQYQVRERKSRPLPVRFAIWELLRPFPVLSGRYFVLSSTAHARGDYLFCELLYPETIGRVVIFRYRSFRILSIVVSTTIDYHLSMKIGSCLLIRSICDASINNMFQSTQWEFEIWAEILRMILHLNEISWRFRLEAREASR